MELEGLFTSSKWMILEEISRESQSPLQLAEKLNTSIANISQQLRLLEVAGIVTRKRLPQRARGKPRVIFSINGDLGYLICAADGFAEKKLLNLNEDHIFILRVWFIDDKSLHEELEKLYWRLKPHLGSVQAVATNGSELFVYVKKDKHDVISKIKKDGSALNKLKLSVEDETQIKKVDVESLDVLYDPEKLLLKEVRGE